MADENWESNYTVLYTIVILRIGTQWYHVFTMHHAWRSGTECLYKLPLGFVWLRLVLDTLVAQRFFFLERTGSSEILALELDENLERVYTCRWLRDCSLFNKKAIFSDAIFFCSNILFVCVCGRQNEMGIQMYFNQYAEFIGGYFLVNWLLVVQMVLFTF